MATPYILDALLHDIAGQLAIAEGLTGLVQPMQFKEWLEEREAELRKARNGLVIYNMELSKRQAEEAAHMENQP